MKKILVVDDDKTVRVLVTLLLKKIDCIAITACDGFEALKIVEDEIPDLVLLDVMMPGMYGWEVARNLRNNERTKNIPIVMMTVKDEKLDVTKGFEAGANEYLIKPFKPSELIRIVEKYINCSES